jgi:activating signal cointegrator complex subunit 3
VCSLTTAATTPVSDAGLFYFDQSFRPVPLALDFVGVTVNNFAARNNLMTEICYNKVSAKSLRGSCVMHLAENGTGRTVLHCVYFVRQLFAAWMMC